MASSDYVSNIQTIARTQELLEKADRALKAAQRAEKTAIEAQRSIAYLKADGGIGNQGGGLPGQTESREEDTDEEKKEDTEKDNKAEDKENDAEADDPSDTDKSNSARGPDEGKVKAKDVIDTANGNATDEQKSNAKLNISVGGAGSTVHITFIVKDTAGNDMAMRQDGQIPVDKGTYVAGTYWEAVLHTDDPNFGVAGADFTKTPEAAIDLTRSSYLAYASEGQRPEDFGAFLGVRYTGSPPGTEPQPLPTIAGGQSFSYMFEDLANPGSFFLRSTGFYRNCPDEPDGTSDLVCLTGEPDGDPYSDNFYIMSFVEDKWVADNLDSKVPAFQNSTMSTMQFTMDGGRFGKLVPASNGGMYLYETDSNGAPLSGSNGVLYRSNMTIQDVIPVADIDYVLPKR